MENSLARPRKFDSVYYWHARGRDFYYRHFKKNLADQDVTLADARASVHDYRVNGTNVGGRNIARDAATIIQNGLIMRQFNRAKQRGRSYRDGVMNLTRLRHADTNGYRQYYELPLAGYQLPPDVSEHVMGFLMPASSDLT